jgi:hypothetical protein
LTSQGGNNRRLGNIGVMKSFVICNLHHIQDVPFDEKPATIACSSELPGNELATKQKIIVACW